jgi:hypothetical protein
MRRRPAQSLKKIISGGQTGVDRAALDFALDCGLPYGGKVPHRWAAEDGPIDRHKYSCLEETQSPDPGHRTKVNVEESDGTLVLTKGAPDRGTCLALQIASDLGKPCLLVDLVAAGISDAAKEVRNFILANRIGVLNVAGPRESQVIGGIYRDALRFLSETFQRRGIS